MTKFLLISEDSEKENLVREVFPTDEVIVSCEQTLIFDILKAGWIYEPTFPQRLCGSVLWGFHH